MIQARALQWLVLGLQRQGAAALRLAPSALFLATAVFSALTGISAWLVLLTALNAVIGIGLSLRRPAA